MELFRLLGTIAIDNTEANRALTDTTDRASDSESKLSSVFGKIGGAAVAAGKVIATGLAAASAAIAGVAKSALDAYADNEQLVGGVETLFGAGGKSLEEYAASVGKTVDDVKDEYYDLMVAQGKVFNYANEAYKTAGMSANEYMETVTSFSAALIKSLDNDTTAAAEKANQAIIDMSDNANKMGSSMESIQNAYNGFAKQNYTMLDNLKLGYGGTKEEMQRLLEDATAISNIEYDISSYADVVDAIHVIQEEMGIAGTTAAEASSTISGSIATMKSAWDNLLVGLAEGDADIDQLLQNLGESILTVFDNVIPRIQLILENIGGVIEKVMPQIVAKIPSILMNILPDLLNAAISMLTAIGNTIITQLPNAVNQIMGLLKSLIESQGVDVAGSFGSIFSSDFIDTMTEWIYYLSDIVVMTITDTASMLAEKIEPIKELFVNLGEAIRPLVETWINGLVVAFDTLLVIWNDVLLPAISLVIDIFTQLATTIVTAITPAIENISSKFQELQQFVSAAIQNYIVPTISMFIEMIQQLWQENQDKINLIGELFSTVFNAIAGIVAWFVDAFKNYIYPFLGWLVGIVQSNMDNIKAVFQSAFDLIGGIVQFFIALFKGDWQGMWEAVKGILQAGYEFIMNVFNLIKSFLTTIGSAIWSVVQNAFENVRLAIVNKINQAKASIDSVFTNIKNIISNKLTEAKNTVSTIFDNIKTAITNKITAAKDAVANVIEKIKGLFNFEWSLPDIKTPHFSISPSGWKISDLLEGVIPTLGIEWYKEGGVLTQPTIFGMNGNNAMIGGEAGAEAIAPISVLQGYVAQAVASQNQGLVDVLSKILDAIMNMDENMGGNLRYALNGMEFKANEREFARLVKAVR